MDIVGTPSPELLNKINSEDARKYVESLSTRQRMNFSAIFPVGKLFFESKLNEIS